MASNARPIRLKTITLPIEHGGWGFLFEPILLAMWVAPTWAGVCFSVGAVATFLLRHPLKLFIRNRHRLRTSRRVQVTAVVAAVYAAVALAFFALAVKLGGWRPVLPLAFLSPFAIVYLAYDSKNQSRDLVPELSGSAGLAALAPAIAIAGGWPVARAFALWTILVLRAIPSILYVRSRLRLERGRATLRWPPILFHVVSLDVLAVLALRSLAPFLAMVGSFALFLRAAFGLSSYRRLKKPKHIGLLELFFGLLYITVVAIGYRFDL